jgi:hypothetical protein
MGLALPALRYLAREYKAKPFEGKILVLGRQYVYATFTEVLDLLKKEGINPQPLDSTFDTTTNIPNWRTHPQRRKNTSDVAFFALLGLKLYTMDISDYEGADYIHDLNNPIPDELNEMFDVVIDGGTMEHLFNTKQCLENITKMTKIGGTIIHLSPSNNTAGHAFYQFSPDLFFDYYFVNKFKKIKGMYVDMPGKESNSKLFGNVKLNSWNLYELNNNYFGKMFLSSNVANVFFKAEKSKESTFNKIPQQGDCFKQDIINESNEKLATSNEKQSFKQKLKDILKPLVRLKPFIWIMEYYYKRKTYNSIYKSPWGLKYKGKI